MHRLLIVLLRAAVTGCVCFNCRYYRTAGAAALLPRHRRSLATSGGGGGSGGSASRLMSILRMRRLLFLLAALVLFTVVYYSLLVDVWPVGGSGRPLEYEQHGRSAMATDGSRYYLLPGDIRVRLRPPPLVVSNRTIERRVLVLTSGYLSLPGIERRPPLQEVAGSAQAALQYAKYPFDVVRGGALAVIPYLEDETRIFYAAIVFEDREAYVGLPDILRDQLEAYCRRYSVGMAILPPTGTGSGSPSAAVPADGPIASSVTARNRGGGQAPAAFDSRLPLKYSIAVDGHNYSLHDVVLPMATPWPTTESLQQTPSLSSSLAQQPLPPPTSSVPLQSKLPTLPAQQSLYRLVRAESVKRDVLLPAAPPSGWTTFEEMHESYVVVASVCAPPPPAFPAGSSANLSAPLGNDTRGSHLSNDCGRRRSLRSDEKGEGGARKESDEEKMAEEDDDVARPVVVLDPGTMDGVRRVFFGYRLSFWLHRALFLDVMSMLSRGLLELPLDRFVQIDIDDVFVGETGTKLQVGDVQELVRTQERWRNQYMPRFTFYLGFSGLFFGSGSDEDRRGDQALVEVKDNFAWFCHTWSHAQPHVFDNESQLHEQLNLNWQFAQEKGLPVDTTYSVAPHHSGVYPIHELLYNAWKSGPLGVQVTSTEEYPHLYPARLRRGFTYRDIKVLPRQVSGVYTKTLFYDRYPGGPQRLEAMVSGGDMFDAFLYNPVNVFMTHQQNYGNRDRLAVYVFDKAFAFVRRYTNVVLRWAPPVQLGTLYFELYPEERWPLWTNPCLDKRHMEIWNMHKSCKSLPSFIIVGPQKTGTTALSSFLQLHPDISSSHPDPVTFEEVHFFGSANYYSGLDWYLSFFDNLRPSNAKLPEEEGSDELATLYFDKSANYFDSTIAPLQVRSLLPSAKIIVILLNPVDRAFSWYHHQKAHGDPAATGHDFYDVITAKANASKEVLQLQARCLVPGFYAAHIENWRKQFSDKQILVVDGHELKLDPANVMHNVQKFLQVKQVYDYSSALVYDAKKQFYCVKTAKGTQCLGASKGRSRYYGTVDERSAEVLQNIYLEPNRNLRKLLDDMGYGLPPWLQAVT